VDYTAVVDEPDQGKRYMDEKLQRELRSPKLSNLFRLARRSQEAWRAKLERAARGRILRVPKHESFHLCFYHCALTLSHPSGSVSPYFQSARLNPKYSRADLKPGAYPAELAAALLSSPMASQSPCVSEEKSYSICQSCTGYEQSGRLALLTKSKDVILFPYPIRHLF
jgi:hypothetical protein